MPSLDSNCLLRWLLEDNVEQAARVQSLLDSDQVFAVDDLALIEMVFVLERQAKLSRSNVKLSLEMLLSQASLDIDRSLWSEVLQTYSSHPKLSVADIFFSVRAKRSGQVPLYTFDKKMLTQLPGCKEPPATGEDF